ncbi:protein farnesyltransferase/geranylgeranyltransferase type-1 subunit alpha [Anthonomus grandis grandis]|uniref:protein farnesyltransferase/geranylgeranyltransferase type-1 subunit alpha n=1 Tax=Anthonomus grandis grandis TaxID=2921223 RepID=UPI002165DE24|nr:protein farnesyltransferase/geranylgeranyltransferase type-1 subunit alpha [Anthonomus grandis grandis]
MSDSSSDECDTQHVLYKNRPEWKDVTPLPQDDGEHPVVAIDYSEEFQDCFDYFRAIVQKKEYSDRALELTKTASSFNPANYTVWQYRRETLKSLGKDLQEELDYIGKVILKQTKNYQVWHHRKILVEWLQDPSKEKFLTEKALSKDAKNYHAWQHRQWVIKTFNLFDGELDYVDQLLKDDVKNNSAWNQRYFVVNNTTGFTENALDNEIDYTLGKIQLLVDNESAWNYLRGLLLHDKGGLSRNKKVTEFCESLYKSGNRSPFLLALIVDMCCERAGESGGGDSDNIYTVERAKELCNSLATEYDTIRAKYWLHVAETIGNPDAEESSSSTN